MNRIKNRTSLLTKYSLLHEKNPRSRVFAPLAETYRKLGMLEEAYRILAEGIKIHPSYTLGYIVLANCYFDSQRFEQAYNTIRPFVVNHLENIKLQKLFAQTCINLGHLEEALETFKYLLLINPKDNYVAEQVKLLEDDLLVSSSYEEINEPKNVFESSSNEDDWVQVNFNETSIPKSDDESWSKENNPAGSDEHWNVKNTSPLDEFKQEITKNQIQVKEHKLDDKFFVEEHDVKAEDVISPEKENTTDKTPIITHTLVNLYCNQGHTDKAIEVLENILELHPGDVASREKLNELKLSLDAGQLEKLLAEKVEKKPAVVASEKSYPFGELQMAFKSFKNKIKDKSMHKLAEI